MTNRRVVKIVISAVVALDLVALSAVALHRTTTTTTVHQRRTADVATGPAVTLAPAPSTPAPTPTLGPPSVSPITVALPPTSTTPSVTPPSTSTSTPPSSPPSTPPVVATVADCPIPLAKPATNGGLQSLIDFAPAFGPFSAEAFAMASAYQPVLQLLGPILAQFPAIEAKAQPQIDAFLKPWESLLNSIFALISPYYSPYREQVLTAETNLASFLAPYAESLADSPLGGCIVDVEAALVGDVQKNSVQQSSSTSVAGRLTHP